MMQVTHVPRLAFSGDAEPRPLRPLRCRLLGALALLTPVACEAQTPARLPLPFILAIIGAVVMLGLLVFYVVTMIKRESRARQPEPKRRRRSSRMPDNPAWRDTGKGRRARDSTDLRVIDDDLPPITMLTGTKWAEKQTETHSQSGLVAGLPAEDTRNVYRTGYNPFFTGAPEQIEVEEVADLVQQAELMTTLANYPAAISMLTRHIRDTEKPSPKAWLMLFDLYSRTDREDQYDNLAKGFRIQFNAQVPSFKEQKSDAGRDLEQYPGVMKRICAAWNTKDIEPLLESLLYDDRGGAREGFVLAAYSELIFLLDLVNARGHLERDEADRRQIEEKLRGKPLA